MKGTPKAKPITPTFHDQHKPIPGLPKHLDPRWITNAHFALWKMRLPKCTFKLPPEPYTWGAIEGWSFAKVKFIERVAPDQKPTPFNSIGITEHISKPFEPACEYFIGFAYGIECCIAEINQQEGRRIRATDREAILEIVLRHSDTVHCMKSLTEFHDWLKSQIGNRAGTLKRCEKICQDIGKTFAPVGRPHLK